MTELNPERARRAIVEHTGRLAESAAAAGPDAAVPTAPEWTVTDLVAHVGQTQHWTAEIIERRVTDPADMPTDVPDLPGDPDRWPEWLAESAVRVASAFSDEALDAQIFNAAGDDRSGARFWLINVLNEAVVHGFDGAGAAHLLAAADLPEIDAGVAAELISHHLAMLTSPTWAMLRPESAQAIQGTGQTLRWLATDTGDGNGAWFVERRPDGATWERENRPADVTVTGPAGTLLLTLTRRVPLGAGGAGVGLGGAGLNGAGRGGVGVEGDAALARHWLDNTAHIAD
ncbi:maleylpyruvate isomerase N-terminal domain-containing protein [Promicromonospora sukumoe]|uniref:maleylpyruvate isomerase N-terminal domain-containing protein n=1 Tax=Promicromonospora sukumoe TaxID=88382 RepID=UPI003647D227